VIRLRHGLAIVGFVLALFSVALDNSIIGWAAIAVLLASALLRLATASRGRPNSTGDPGV
jgi:hypothetical protein